MGPAARPAPACEGKKEGRKKEPGVFQPLSRPLLGSQILPKVAAMDQSAFHDFSQMQDYTRFFGL
jgi:hypothetical protein